MMGGLRTGIRAGDAIVRRGVEPSSNTEKTEKNREERSKSRCSAEIVRDIVPLTFAPSLIPQQFSEFMHDVS